MIPTPWAFSSRTTRKRSSTSRSPSEAVGSSMIRMRASAPRARAISTSCCSGIERRRTSVSGSMLAPIRDSSCRARSRRLRQRTRSPGAARFEAEGDVLGDGQVGEEGRLLVDRGDAEGAGADGVVVDDRLAEDFERALVGGVGAGDDLDERRFAGAVLADESVDLPGAEVERDTAEGLDAGEGLVDVGQLEQLSHEGDWNLRKYSRGSRVNNKPAVRRGGRGRRVRRNGPRQARRGRRGRRKSRSGSPRRRHGAAT